MEVLTLDEMMMELAREYFSGMNKEEKKELLHSFLDTLSDEEKKEVLEFVLSEFAKDERMLKRIQAFLKSRAKK